MKQTPSLLSAFQKPWPFFTLLSLLFLFCLGCGSKSGEQAKGNAADSGAYTIESITQVVEAGDTNFFPHVISRTGNQAGETKINNAIRDFFLLTSFDPKEKQETMWHGLRFTAASGQDVVALHITGSALGAYATEYDTDLFITDQGEVLYATAFPLLALLSPEHYFSFLDQHWTAKASKEFEKAAQCADDIQIACSIYDINTGVTDQQLVLTLKNEECFPHVAAACAPSVEVKVPLATVTPFLSEFGKKVIASGYYAQKSPLKKFEASRSLQDSLPNVLVLRLKRPDVNFDYGGSFSYPETTLRLVFKPTNKFEGTLEAVVDMDDLPADFRGTDSFSPNDQPQNYTGTFNYGGFLLTRPCDDEGAGSDCLDSLRFQWKDEYDENAFATGGRYLLSDLGTIHYAGYTTNRFFYKPKKENGTGVAELP